MCRRESKYVEALGKAWRRQASFLLETLHCKLVEDLDPNQARNSIFKVCEPLLEGLNQALSDQLDIILLKSYNILIAHENSRVET
jgi:hypothetical protein